MAGLLNGRTDAKEQKWKWCVQICICKKKKKDMNWDPEQSWEGFFPSAPMRFSLPTALLMENDPFDSCGLIHIVCMKITITDVTGMLA